MLLAAMAITTIFAQANEAADIADNAAAAVQEEVKDAASSAVEAATDEANATKEETTEEKN